jgi:hypothetical protein
MRLGYNIWSSEHFSNVLSPNSSFLSNCRKYGVEWIAVCDLYTVPSINAGSPFIHDYKGETKPNKIVDVMKKLKDNGFNVLLKIQVHSINSLGLKPEWGAFWIKAADYLLFFVELKNAMVNYIDYFDKGGGKGGLIDALCIATELDSMAAYVDS